MGTMFIRSSSCKVPFRLRRFCSSWKSKLVTKIWKEEKNCSDEVIHHQFWTVWGHQACKLKTNTNHKISKFLREENTHIEAQPVKGCHVCSIQSVQFQTLHYICFPPSIHCLSWYFKFRNKQMYQVVKNEGINGDEALVGAGLRQGHNVIRNWSSL